VCWGSCCGSDRRGGLEGEVARKVARVEQPVEVVSADDPAERPLWVSSAGVEEPARVYLAGRRVGGRHEEGKVLPCSVVSADSRPGSPRVAGSPAARARSTMPRAVCASRSSVECECFRSSGAAYVRGR
jgi:hypothetical protein